MSGPKNVVITGGAGFIGSNLADALLGHGYSVTVADNFSTGRQGFIAQAVNNGATIRHGDLKSREFCHSVIEGSDAVVHLAANADVRFGWNHPERDLHENIIVTHNVLEAMRATGVKRLIFSSTGSVYGETKVVPTPENAPFPHQTSLYGASKAAAEGLISAYSEGAGIEATVFRFVSILGPRYTHGHVIDFVAQLLDHPQYLRILGDGSQRKSYLHVSDCISAVMSRLAERPKYEVLNLGTNEYCSVVSSARWICDHMGIAPQIEFSGGERGWIGDNPFIFLDTSQIQNLGWQPKFDIKSAVEDTVGWILSNQWVLDAAVR